MNILAFDTSTAACSIALQYEGKLHSIHKIAPMQQARLILPLIHDLFSAAAINLNQLDAIAFGAGPGSFTGIRIASSVAQGLAFTANLPIIRVSSLAAMAQTAYLETNAAAKNMLVAVDARMQQIYFARYAIDTTGLAILSGEERLCSPDELPTMVASDCYGIGDAWDVYNDKIIKRLGVKPEIILANQLPTGIAVLKLAERKFAERDWVAVSDAIPVYLR